MYIKSIRLRDFAGLERVDDLGFEPGLNVVVGDNEAGKSTLLMALRAAFFQKHRAGGEGARMLAPYGRQARPEVEVAFTIGGTEYALRKSFLQKPDAELTWTQGRLAGDAVEDRLAELLRFTHSAARKGRDGDYAGAFGLLWVDQGRSTQGLDVGSGRDAVTASLEGEVGRMLGGEEARGLLAAAKSWQDRFFTDKLRVVVSSPLREAEERLAALTEELAERRQAHRDYEDKIDRLANRRETLRAYDRDDAIGEAERALVRAEESVRAIGGLHREWRDADGALKAAALRWEHLGQALRERETLRERSRDAERDAAAARETLSDATAANRREGEEFERRIAARDALRTRTHEAETRAEAAREAAERRRDAADIADLERRLGQAGGLAERREAVAPRANAPVPDDRALRRIETAEAAARDAQIRLEVAAPTLHLLPDGECSASEENGAPVPVREPFAVTRRLRLRLEGFGTIAVEPGGNAEELGQAKAEADRALAALLREHRVASLAEARRRADDRAAARADLVRIDAELGALLPEGWEATLARLTERRAAMASAPAPSGEPEDPRRLRAHWSTLRDELTALETVCEAARRDAGARAAALAAAERDAEHRAENARSLRAQWLAAEAERTIAALQSDWKAADMERAAKALVAEHHRTALDNADAETAERTLQAKRRALDEVRRAVAQLREEVSRLEGELRVQGATALGEDIGRLAADSEAAERERARLALEADAARLLYGTLAEAQREARESWLGPIKARVQPYLRLIHPGTDVDLDETTLEITGLRRAGVEEEFRRLSAGAREQVAVVTRLALADVLKGGGHPALVILDDALVNTDEKRLERMHLVLQKASEGVQIIVLTCRERDFRGLGAPILRL